MSFDRRRYAGHCAWRAEECHGQDRHLSMKGEGSDDYGSLVLLTLPPSPLPIPTPHRATVVTLTKIMLLLCPSLSGPPVAFTIKPVGPTPVGRTSVPSQVICGFASSSPLPQFTWAALLFCEIARHRPPPTIALALPTVSVLFLYTLQCLTFFSKSLLKSPLI